MDQYAANVKMKFKYLKKTCEASPTQWEGVTTNNRPMYFRYRWGYCSVYLGPRQFNTVKEALRHISEAVGGEAIYSERHGAALDGYMEDDEVMCILWGLSDA